LVEIDTTPRKDTIGATLLDPIRHETATTADIFRSSIQEPDGALSSQWFNATHLGNI
jgi:hypothetical protein